MNDKVYDEHYDENLERCRRVREAIGRKFGNIHDLMAHYRKMDRERLRAEKKKRDAKIVRAKRPVQRAKRLLKKSA